MAGWTVPTRARGRGGWRADVKFVLIVLFAIALGVYAHKQRSVPPADTVTGYARIIDGDSIEIAHARIRLEAIDAPELRQTCRDARGADWPCGTASARELRQLVGARELRCDSSRLDQYRRLLAICHLPDGTDVNGWMVRHGWALAFRNTTRYRAEQREAQNAKRGLWAGTFVPPWEWRDHGDE